MRSELYTYVRPLRHAYFIQEDDLARFQDMAAYCCTQWGGINNLIIPVKIATSTSGAVTIDISSRFDLALKRRIPHFFIDAVTDQLEYEEANEVSRQLQDFVRGINATAFLHVWDQFLEIDDCLHPLGIIAPAAAAIRPTLYRAVIDAHESPGELDQALLVAAFGKIWNDQLSDYSAAFELHAWPATDPTTVLRAQCDISPFSSVINLTLRQMRNLGSEPIRHVKHFDVVVAQNCADLCWYWAVRAQSYGHYNVVDRRTLVLTKAQVLTERYLTALTQLIRERKGHPTIQSNLDVLFHHSDEEIVAYLASRKEFARLEGDIRVRRTRFGEPITSEPAETSEATQESDLTGTPITYLEGPYETRAMLRWRNLSISTMAAHRRPMLLT